MTPASSPPKLVPSKRRRLRFSLRTAMLAMAVVSVVLGLVCAQVRRGNQQARIVAELRQMGARVDYDIRLWTKEDRFGDAEETLAMAVHWCGAENYFYNAGYVRCFAELSPSDSRRFFQLVHQLPSVQFLELTGVETNAADLTTLLRRTKLSRLSVDHYPKFRTRQLSDDELIPLRCAKDLVNLSLNRQPVSDAGIAYLDQCQKLRYLELSGTKIGNEGLAHLSCLTEIEQLDLWQTKISDSGLKHLASLDCLNGFSFAETRINGSGFINMGPKNSLTSLNGRKSEIDDAGLKGLANFPQLKSLNFSATRIRGPGLKHLSQLNHLSRLELDDCPITDEGVKNLLALPQSCVEVHLARTQLTDTGVISLKLSPNLYELDLQGTSVTDATMEYLIRYKELHRVNVIGTQVTKQGIDRLRGAKYDRYIETDVPW